MIYVTTAAAEKIRSNLTKRGKGVGIHVGIRTTGCSGMAYVLEYLDSNNSNDMIVDYTFNGFVIRVYKKDNVYVDGMTVDCIRQGLNEGFEFINPIEKDRCGCGESFRV